MKPNNGTTIAVTTLLLAGVFGVANAQPRVSIRLEFGGPAVRGHYDALGESYGVPERDIWVMHEAGIVDEDIPVILYIHANSHYSLRQIYSLRLRGATWENLSNWCGVPLFRDRGGPPYGNAYGYYKHGPGKYRENARPWDDDGYRNNGKSWKTGRGKARGHGDRD